jgi:hypothetical protein
MTDARTLLAFAARCRRMAGRCRTPAIARKFEALAEDYEEYVRLLERGSVLALEAAPDMIEPRVAASR